MKDTCTGSLTVCFRLLLCRLYLIRRIADHCVKLEHLHFKLLVVPCVAATDLVVEFLGFVLEHFHEVLDVLCVDRRLVVVADERTPRDRPRHGRFAHDEERTRYHLAPELCKRRRSHRVLRHVAKFAAVERIRHVERIESGFRIDFEDFGVRDGEERRAVSRDA